MGETPGIPLWGGGGQPELERCPLRGPRGSSPKGTLPGKELKGREWTGTPWPRWAGAGVGHSLQWVSSSPCSQSSSLSHVQLMGMQRPLGQAK